MAGIIAWLGTNGPLLILAISSLLGVASLFTGLTKTPKDDEIVAGLKRVLSFFSGTTHTDAPGTFKLPGTKAPSAKDLMAERAKADEPPSDPSVGQQRFKSTRGTGDKIR